MVSTAELLQEPLSPAEPRSLTSRSPADSAAAADVQHQLTQLTAITDLVCRLESTANQQQACQTLADQLKEHLSAKAAFIGLCGENSPACRLAAISHVTAFQSRDPRVTAAQNVLQEVIARGEMVSWPPAVNDERGGMMAHRQYAAERNLIGIVSGPLHDAQGHLIGAWMVTFDEPRSQPQRSAEFLRAAEAPVAAALHVIGRAESGRVQQAIRSVTRFARTQRALACLVVAAVAIGLLCIPIPYRPRCDCTIEPVARRFVAVPFDGRLEKALVEPGDEVAEGDTLARMDSREVRWELAGTRADLHRAAKERAGHMATHESGRAEVARFEVDRLKMRTEMLENRNENLEIRSPIAGVVVSGSWEDAEGVPLEVGHNLFEIAPLDHMIVEIAVAEDNFAHVRAGMPVSVRLDAYPLRKFAGTIERVHPRSELLDDENVFIAEVRIANEDGSLRPGMHGAARIRGDWHTVGWILLRRPVSAVVSWLGW